MHLLIVTPIFPPQIGGPASYVSGLLERLQRQDEVNVVTFAESKISNQKIIHGVSTSGNMLSRQARLLLQLFKLTQKNQIMYAQGTVVVGVASLIVSKIRKIPLVVKFVGDEVWEALVEAGRTEETLEAFYAHNHILNLKLYLHRLVLKCANKIIVPSKYLRDFLVSVHGLSSKKIAIVANAVEIPAKIKISSVRDANKIVFVGRLVPWKHVDQIIEAVSLARSFKPWTLTIIGNGVERSNLETQAKQLKAESWVKFKGKLSKTESLSEMITSAQLVLYSSYEGQPHTLIEAMLLNTPIIASSIPPHTELLGNKDLVQPNNPKALAHAINSEIKNAHVLVDPLQFSWHNHIQKLESVLKELQ